MKQSVCIFVAIGLSQSSKIYLSLLFRFAQMVIKTDPCDFSEMKIYPGKGSKFAGKDGKVHYFISSKCRSLYHQKIKPVKLTWTQAWRR